MLENSDAELVEKKMLLNLSGHRYRVDAFPLHSL